ncbi:MAG TPA: sigma factor-like helix-turn-helix DNA-binding protein [Anaerolineaceae bacterium]|nr:sigma factor-like helix-turn-helix DNA-binding protein [Anaerolineaceae bacterium]
MEYEGFNLGDLFGTEDIDSIDRKIEFERMFDSLKARDKRIVYLYATGHNYDEIGEMTGITKGRVCQILSNIKQRLE